MKTIQALALTLALGAASLAGSATLGDNAAEAGYRHGHGHRYAHSYGYKHFGYGYGHRHYKPTYFYGYGCKVWGYDGYHKKCVKWW